MCFDNREVLKTGVEGSKVKTIYIVLKQPQQSALLGKTSAAHTRLVHQTPN